VDSAPPTDQAILSVLRTARALESVATGTARRAAFRTTRHLIALTGISEAQIADWEKVAMVRRGGAGPGGTSGYRASGMLATGTA